jgi:hypothetical protein
MNGDAVRRFGALELDDGALWLGRPRARFRPGIRLGAYGLSQWGAPGPQESSWESIAGLEVLVGEPEARGRVARAFERVESAADWFSLATGMSARWYKEHNGGVRLDWHSRATGEKRWAAAAVNWHRPLSEPERHAARAVLAALGRSVPLRDRLRSEAGITGLLTDLARASSRGDVDRILAQRGDGN